MNAEVIVSANNSWRSRGPTEVRASRLGNVTEAWRHLPSSSTRIRAKVLTRPGRGPNFSTDTSNCVRNTGRRRRPTPIPARARPASGPPVSETACVARRFDQPVAQHGEREVGRRSPTRRRIKGVEGRNLGPVELDSGHHTTAYVRTPAKLALADENLTVATGRLYDNKAIRKAVAGADAVISALGPSLKRSVKGTAITDGTRTIVEAMQAEGVTRFIGLATPSLADPHDRPHWKPKVLPVMAKLAFPNALAELKGMTEAVTSSPLDYTIARITNPLDKPATGRIKCGFLGHDKVGSAMTRADIAAFLVSQLIDTRYSRAMPAISN
ncbi:NAD(P)-dependent oxidoreductase [Streptomyces sp. NPDC057136]|uniref:NAD(P)-dependent oxidoreductase n=1 Tax=Streptomyces sp. NPDC057136 TaxID=3346029 RepID=UPI003640B6E2